MQFMSDRLRKIELYGIMLLLAFHVFLFPVGAMYGVGLGLIPSGITDGELNLVYYGISLLLTFIFAGKYLRRSFDSLIDAPLHSVLCIALSWLVYLVLILVFNSLLTQFEFFNTQNPNDAVITAVAEADKRSVIAFSVIMAPIVEEVIFRGGIFCGLYYKNRIAAYTVSVLAFSLYHVWQYAVFGDISMLLFALQYIPAAFALCWCYERSGSIWASIFFHMSMNLWGIAAL